MYRWDGAAMQPIPYFQKTAAAEFKQGETYRLVEMSDRSIRSHRHFFACLNEAWQNFSDDEKEQFPSVEYLRKWCLTYTSFCDMYETTLPTIAEAYRMREHIKRRSVYSRVSITTTAAGTVLREFVPHSQSLILMPHNRTFQKSKSEVLDVLARKLGVTIEELEEAGRRSA